MSLPPFSLSGILWLQHVTKIQPRNQNSPVTSLFSFSSCTSLRMARISARRFGAVAYTLPLSASEMSYSSSALGRVGDDAMVTVPGALCPSTKLGISTSRSPWTAATAPEAQPVSTLAAPPITPEPTAPRACPASCPPAPMARPKPIEESCMRLCMLCWVIWKSTSEAHTLHTFAPMRRVMQCECTLAAQLMH